MIQTPSAGPIAPRSSDWRLTHYLRRWRSTFVVAVLTMATLVIVDYALVRAATERVAHSGAVLRTATTAQALTWTTESAIRGLALRSDSAAPARATSARDSLVALLSDLRELTSDDPIQHTRVGTLALAVERWGSVFVDPILGGAPLTIELARDATDAFDDVSEEFDQVIAHQSSVRLAALRTLGRTELVGALMMMLSLLVISLAFVRVSKRLVAESELARRQQDLLEEQATEMEVQATQVEQQAAVLEEQAAELEHRIEERDETNRLLEETAAYLDSAVESAPVGVAFFDRNLRFVRVNEALASMHGVPGAAHVGRSLPEVIPGIASSVTPILARVLRTGVPESDEAVEFASEAAGPRQWRLTCYPLRSKGRPPIGVGVMMLDVTERAQLEDQLRQSQKMEAVGRLAGGVAHDFNNVLTIIQSYAELLAADLEAGVPGHEEVDAIRGAADRAAALARQLLSFSRREVVIPRVIDVNEVLQGMQGIFERLMRQGVELRMELSPVPLLVRADSGQVEQVLMNLVINAVDAMPGGGELRVATAMTNSVGPTAGAGGGRAEVEISVRDTGTGMTPEVQQRIFEPFFTTKPAGQGTGLGLATAYAIVRAADGNIRVHTALGEGTRFDVTFPRRSESDREPEPRSSPFRGSPAARAGETVLLVEDEPAIREALARVLRANGYRVIEASNGGEALRRAQEEPGAIDLMLTDVMMPGIGGKELVQRLLVTRPQTRVILMSGYTDDDLLRRELGDARYVFLQKPFAARQAVAAVRDLLDAD